jgi:hypothetical protein
MGHVHTLKKEQMNIDTMFNKSTDSIIRTEMENMWGITPVNVTGHVQYTLM